MDTEARSPLPGGQATDASHLGAPETEARSPLPGGQATDASLLGSRSPLPGGQAADASLLGSRSPLPGGPIEALILSNSDLLTPNGRKAALQQLDAMHCTAQRLLTAARNRPEIMTDKWFAFLLEVMQTTREAQRYYNAIESSLSAYQARLTVLEAQNRSLKHRLEAQCSKQN